MDFDLTEDQREIKTVARELLTARSPFAKVREAAEAAEYDDALWREIVGLGWPGIAVAEEHGGQGLGAVELGVLLEELGYACAATPFLATAVAAAVIQASGTEEQRRRWLPGLIDGELRAGVGSPEFVVDGHGADVVVLLEDDGARLLAAPESEPLVAIDPTRRFATVRGEGEALAADAADRVRAAIAAEVVGVCQRALEMTLEYVEGAQAVRGPGGILPGRFAPLRADAAAHRERPAPPPTTRRGPPTRSPRAWARRRRWPRRLRRRARVRCRRRRSRPTAASASPGRRTCIGCTSGARWTARCWAAPSATTPRCARAAAQRLAVSGVLTTRRAGRGARSVAAAPERQGSVPRRRTAS